MKWTFIEKKVRSFPLSLHYSYLQSLLRSFDFLCHGVLYFLYLLNVFSMRYPAQESGKVVHVRIDVRIQVLSEN